MDSETSCVSADISHGVAYLLPSSTLILKTSEIEPQEHQRPTLNDGNRIYAQRTKMVIATCE